MAEPIWISLKRYAELRGVTSDALLKAIKRGRLGAPHRRSNIDGRGSIEVQVDPAELAPEPPVPDRSVTPPPTPLEAELEAVRAHLTSVASERDRALAERDQERERLELARQDHAAAARRLQDQLDVLAARLADLAREAGRAEAEAATARAELELRRKRGWWARVMGGP